jgi:hypothetical protein
MSRIINTTGNAEMNSSAFDENTSGTLGTIVHQGFDGPHVNENNVRTLAEKFKGSYKTLRDLHLTSFRIGYERPTQLIEGGLFLTEFKAPKASLDEKKRWFVTDVSVEELEAGDHAIMTVSYIAKNPKDGDTYYSQDEAEEITDTWQMQTQETEFSIYGYCTTNPSPSDNNVKWIKLWEQESGEIYRLFDYTNPEDGNIYSLTEAGEAIAKKIMQGITAIKTYVPVIVHTTIYGSGKLENINIAEDVGYRDTPNCPAWQSLIDKFDWLKIGDDVTAEFSNNQVVKQTRTERWMGSRTKLPDEFYSKDPTKRWKIPMMSAIEFGESI